MARGFEVFLRFKRFESFPSAKGGGGVNYDG